jgi:hypothetical protein
MNSGDPRTWCVTQAAAHKAALACVQLGLAAADEVTRLVEASAGRPAVLLHHVISRHPSLVELRRWLFESGDDR